jgi:hypothetical protein
MEIEIPIYTVEWEGGNKPFSLFPNTFFNIQNLKLLTEKKLT